MRAFKKMAPAMGIGFSQLAAGVVCLLLAAPAAFAHGHQAGHAEKKAHTHGSASLELTLDGQTLNGHLHGAMDNFLPFEHSPKTDAQKQQVNALQEKLKDARWLVLPTAAARCEPLPVKASSKMFEGKAYKGHADLEVSFAFRCEAPEALKSLELTVLKNSPRLKSLAVEWAMPSGQGAAKRSAKDPTLSF